jgi:hypothetical protein
MDEYKQIRESLKNMRNAKKGVEFTPIPKVVEVNENMSRSMSMREMLGKTRKMREDNTPVNQEKTITPLDIKNEEEKIQKNFENLGVSAIIKDFKVYDNGVFLSGSIDDTITFTYSVSPSEEGSGVEWVATDQFDAQAEDNQKVIERLEAYYDEFYQYWRDNELQI